MIMRLIEIYANSWHFVQVFMVLGLVAMVLVPLVLLYAYYRRVPHPSALLIVQQEKTHISIIVHANAPFTNAQIGEILNLTRRGQGHDLVFPFMKEKEKDDKDDKPN